MVLGVLLVILIVGGYFLVSEVGTKQLFAQETKVRGNVALAMPVQQFVESCLSVVSQEQLLNIAEHGGFYRVEEPFIDESERTLPYYFSTEGNTVPSLEKIEHQLNDAIEEGIVSCVGDFSVFREQGYAIETELPNVTSQIIPEKVVVRLDYIIRIQKENQQAEINRLTTTVPYDFHEKIMFVNQFISEQEKDPTLLPLTYLLDTAEQQGFTFEMLYFSDTTVGFNLLFDDSALYRPFIYSFAVKYPEFPEEVTPVLLDDMVPDVVPEQDHFTVRKGEKFIYQVPLLSGENVKFYDFTELFDIDERTGVIVFETGSVAVGRYTALIQVIDERGQSDIKELIVEIV